MIHLRQPLSLLTRRHGLFASPSIHSHHFQRRFRRNHTDAQTAACFPPIFQVWGANTDVGKTVFSACLLSASSVTSPSMYVKPVQSGYPKDDDAKFVSTYASNTQCVTLYTYGEAVSPDLAARRLQSTTTQNVIVPDSHIINSISHMLNQFRNDCIQLKSHSTTLALVETAGGILSPTPQGNLQADAYRQLRLPGILVGDNKLGGISTTLTAYETLRNRGYDIPVIVSFRNDGHSNLENESSIQKHIDNSVNDVPISFSNTKVFQAPPLPKLGSDNLSKLHEYLSQSDTNEFFNNLIQHLRVIEETKLNDIQQMINDANTVFWYPFTQHSRPSKVLYFDSAYNDSITTYDSDDQQMTLQKNDMIDAMGSWWTNGAGHGNVHLAKTIGYAAGRYGHVMFAEAVSKPTIELAKKLLGRGGPGEGWGGRVFYSDNGSTAMEVALKMALRKRKMDVPERNHLKEVKIIALTDSYHGDTLGVMDCSEESDFNSQQTPWYQARGVFLKPATVALRNGVWVLSKPNWLLSDNGRESIEDLNTGVDEEEILSFSSWREMFKERCHNNEKEEKEYELVIGNKLDDVLNQNEFDLGGLVIEPILQGAGGMNLIDATFQRALVKACRNRKIPVVFDEVFTGFYRLGEVSASKILGIEPDIAAYSKLLTGGTVPLSVTVATEEVLRAFDGESKKEALLHGHSYTAHAIGCAAAVQSLDIYDRVFNSNEQTQRRDWWDENYAREVSSHKLVDRVVTIGTVLAVKMKPSGSDGEGYAATGSKEVVKRLGKAGIFARPLGNVVYLMCTPLSDPSVCSSLSKVLVRVLDDMDEDGNEEQG